MHPSQAVLPLPGYGPRPGGLPHAAHLRCSWRRTLLLVRSTRPHCCKRERRRTRVTIELTNHQRNCPTPGVAGAGLIPGAGRGGPAGRGGFVGGGGRGGYVARNPAAMCYKCGGPNHFARDCQAQAMKCERGRLGTLDQLVNHHHLQVMRAESLDTSAVTAPPPTVDH